MTDQKRCSKCKEIKDVGLFGKYRSSKDGLKSACKDCRSVEGKKYSKENKDEARIYSKKYREENLEKMKVMGAKYYLENLEKVKARRAKYYLENPEKLKVMGAKYREENAEKLRFYAAKYSKTEAGKASIKASSHRRNAKKAGNGGSYTAEEWLILCDMYDHKCACCKKKTKLTADHIIPISKGGTSYIDNIQPLCKSCNSSKGAHHSTDYALLK